MTPPEQDGLVERDKSISQSCVEVQLAHRQEVRARLFQAMGLASALSDPSHPIYEESWRVKKVATEITELLALALASDLFDTQAALPPPKTDGGSDETG